MDNALQHYARAKNYFIFIKKIQCGDRDGAGYPNPLEKRMIFNFSLNMDKVTSC